ncbi:hypothetical protein Tco_1169400 [Tanacetum coccineum]
MGSVRDVGVATRGEGVTKGWRRVWADILKIGAEIEGVGVYFTSSCVGVLGDRRDIRFWEDRWVDNRRLCDRFPRLYHLDRRKEGSVFDKGYWVNNWWNRAWEWNMTISGRRLMLDEDGDFKVKTLTSLIKEKILQGDSGGVDTIWNKLVPKKVNIFG